MTTKVALAHGDVVALRRLLWAPQQPAQDIERWLQQGFVFQPPSGPFPLGLVQGHGGPCGVLAAVQAELLRVHLFPQRTELAVDDRKMLLLNEMTKETQSDALVRALASILFRAATANRPQEVTIRIVEVSGGPSDATPVLERDFCETSLTVSNPTEATLLQVLHDQLDVYHSPVGVVLFVFSVLRTKHIGAIREEMDDADSTLTGTFGHCGQELLNLLLTGEASSNVFDGAVPMGDTGLMLRGVQRRPLLGYLTQLEALRYCQVGNYFKCPQTPVWVIASSSHFSVCFGLDDNLCESSASEMMYQRIQRVFKSFDTMETGFIEIGHLRDSLAQLGVSNDILASEFYMAQLSARLEVSGAGIVLWDEYWKVVSVLVHTNNFDLALSGAYTSQQTQVARPKSDEDIARELQAQFDAEMQGTPPPTSSVTAQQPSQEKFTLYYYNGLSRPANNAVEVRASHPEAVAAVVSVPHRQEFIGQSIPLELSTSTGSGTHSGHPLEEILKTKWSSASYDWNGKPVPKVD